MFAFDFRPACLHLVNLQDMRPLPVTTVFLCSPAVSVIRGRFSFAQLAPDRTQNPYWWKATSFDDNSITSDTFVDSKRKNLIWAPLFRSYTPSLGAPSGT